MAVNIDFFDDAQKQLEKWAIFARFPMTQVYILAVQRDTKFRERAPLIN